MVNKHPTTPWLILIALPLFSFVLILIFRLNFLVSTLLFFGLPSLYLSIKNPQTFLKTSIFSFLFSVPLTFILDYLLVKDNAWYIVSSSFPSRLFGTVALDQFFWTFLCIYFIISTYEYFFDRKSPRRKDFLVSKSTLVFGLSLFFLAFLLIGAILTKTQIPPLPYAYGFFGIVIIIIPLILFLSHFPLFFFRFLKITLYFFILSLLVEYAGTSLNQWVFPGSHYLFTVPYFGVNIPFEEVLFYFILSAPALLTYYEYLDDDRK